MASSWTNFQSNIVLDKVSGTETYYPFIKGNVPVGEFWLSNRAAGGAQRYIRRATSVAKDGTRNENLALTQVDVTNGVPNTTGAFLTLRGKDELIVPATLTDLLTELAAALGVSGFIASLANNGY
jgi:hypothetical protein